MLLLSSYLSLDVIHFVLGPVGNSEPGSSRKTSRGGGWALPSTQRPEDNSGVASGNHAAQMPRTGKKASDRGFHGRMRA